MGYAKYFDGMDLISPGRHLFSGSRHRQTYLAAPFASIAALHLDVTSCVEKSVIYPRLPRTTATRSGYRSPYQDEPEHEGVSNSQSAPCAATYGG
ncbi:MAG TPA: hypothetical protein VGO75_08910 [Gemmatimonadaceae bacterium]|nr:hypothetical protein [Gemmatimonadaceae bacterium]